MKLFLFVTIFLAFAGGVSVYFTWRLFCNASISRIWKVAVFLSIITIFLLTLLTILLRRAGVDNAWVAVLVWSGYLGLGFLSFLFTFVAIRDILLSPVFFLRMLRKILTVHKMRRKSTPAVLEDPSRRGFLVTGGYYGMMGAAGVFTVYGLTQAKQIPGVKKITVPVAGLPRDLKDFRIVQITDIHVSPTIRRPFVEKVVQVVNGLGADIVVLTGDLVDGTVRQLSSDVAPLAGLRSNEGNFFVTGNHEYYSGVLPWVEKIRTLGFTVLLNEHRVLKRGRGLILLGGVTDYRGGNFMPSHRSDPQEAIAGGPPVDVKILLAHQPRSIMAAARAGFDLQISGHTHGGQFFPWNFFVGLTQPFIAGLHRFQNTQIYVSRGTGYWGPPIRLGAPPEITLIRLAAS